MKEKQYCAASFPLLLSGSSVCIYASLDNKLTCSIALNIACSLPAVITHYTEFNEQKQSGFLNLCKLGCKLLGKTFRLNCLFSLAVC